MKQTVLRTATALCAGCFMAFTAATAQTADEALQIVHKVNDHWISTRKAEVTPFWHQAVYQTGNMEAYKLTKKQAYRDFAERWAKHNKWMGATSNNRAEWKYSYGEKPDFVLFGDWQCCFQTYADLYELAPDPQKIARAREVMEYAMNQPNRDWWWWADALYMAMPVMTKYYKLTGNEEYLNKMYTYFDYADRLMYDNEEHFYYRDGRYVWPKHKTISGKKDFWARGDGWVLAGLAKVLQDLPTSWKNYAFFELRFRQLADAAKRTQQPEGHWSRSILDEKFAPGYETSGTALFTYGMAWGVNHGLLDRAAYDKTIRKAWKYLSTVALQKDGSVGYVQPIGDRAIPGQVINANSVQDFGTGAYLLAACEMYRYLGGK